MLNRQFECIYWFIKRSWLAWYWLAMMPRFPSLWCVEVSSIRLVALSSYPFGSFYLPILKTSIDKDRIATFRPMHLSSFLCANKLKMFPNYFRQQNCNPFGGISANSWNIRIALSNDIANYEKCFPIETSEKYYKLIFILWNHLHIKSSIVGICWPNKRNEKYYLWK